MQQSGHWITADCGNELAGSSWGLATGRIPRWSRTSSSSGARFQFQAPLPARACAFSLPFALARRDLGPATLKRDGYLALVSPSETTAQTLALASSALANLFQGTPSKY